MATNANECFKRAATGLRLVSRNSGTLAASNKLFLQTSLKPVEVLSLCHIFKEFQKKSQEKLSQLESLDLEPQIILSLS